MKDYLNVNTGAKVRVSQQEQHFVEHDLQDLFTQTN